MLRNNAYRRLGRLDIACIHYDDREVCAFSDVINVLMTYNHARLLILKDFREVLISLILMVHRWTCQSQRGVVRRVLCMTVMYDYNRVSTMVVHACLDLGGEPSPYVEG